VWTLKSSRCSNAKASTAGLESTPGLELEGRTHVDGLAVAPDVLEGRHAVALDIVSDAAGHRDASRNVVGSAGVERIIVALAKRCHRMPIALFRAHRDPG